MGLEEKTGSFGRGAPRKWGMYLLLGSLLTPGCDSNETQPTLSTNYSGNVASVVENYDSSEGDNAQGKNQALSKDDETQNDPESVIRQLYQLGESMNGQERVKKHRKGNYSSLITQSLGILPPTVHPKRLAGYKIQPRASDERTATVVVTEMLQAPKGERNIKYTLINSDQHWQVTGARLLRH